MVLPPSKRRKAPKKSLDSMSKLFFNPSECNKLHPPPFAREAKKVYLIPGSSKSVSFLGRGEMNGVCIINFVKFIQTRNFFRRGAL